MNMDLFQVCDNYITSLNIISLHHIFFFFYSWFQLHCDQSNEVTRQSKNIQELKCHPGSQSTQLFQLILIHTFFFCLFPFKIFCQEVHFLAIWVFFFFQFCTQACYISINSCPNDHINSSVLLKRKKKGNVVVQDGCVSEFGYTVSQSVLFRLQKVTLCPKSQVFVLLFKSWMHFEVDILPESSWLLLFAKCQSHTKQANMLNL